MALEFSTTGIDLSGLGEGIAKGLQQRAENVRYENKLLNQEFQEFSRTFDASKINEPGDATAYTDAVFQWKEKKKEALKAQRGGLFKRADVEKANQLETEADDAYKQAANVYASRVQINTLATQYINRIKQIEQQKRVVPSSLYDTLNYLRTHPSSQIDVNDIPDPSSFNVNASYQEMANYKKSFQDPKHVATNVGVEKLSSTPILEGYGKDKKGISLDKYAEFSYATPEQAYKNAKVAEKTPLENNLTADFEDFAQSLVSQNPAIRIPAEEKQKQIVQTYGIDPANIDKYHLAVVNNDGLAKMYKAPKYDTTPVNMFFKEIGLKNAEERRKISSGFLQAAREKNANDKEFAKEMKMMAFISDPTTEALFKNSSKFKEMAKGYVDNADKFYEDVNSIMSKGKVSLAEALHLAARGASVTSSK